MRTAFVCVVALVITSVFFINFCNLIFACGCRSLWNGADMHCNRHAPAGSKHCPFCSHGSAGYALFFGGIVAPQLLVARALRTRALWMQLSGAVLTFPIAGGAMAAVVGLLDGYWLP